LGTLDERVLDLLRAVGREELLPRFRQPGLGQARHKSPGEVVTDADLAAERALAAGLSDLLPESLVVGEEGSHADKDLPLAVADHPCVWVVDPLDGTKHFAAGQDTFGVMVALLRRGRVEAAWIHLPVPDRSVRGRRGEGVFLDGVRVAVPSPPPFENLRGALLTRFLPEPLKRVVEADETLERTDGDHHCAAQRYIDLLAGREHFALYYRTLPWDHAPGAFLAEEAGATVRRFDGTPYHPGDGRQGLLVAADTATWSALRDRLLPEHPRAL